MLALFGSVLLFSLCSVGRSTFVQRHPSPPSYVLGGNPNYDVKNDPYGAACGQFKDDFDVLRQLPFRIQVEPEDGGDDLSIVQLNDDNRTVRMMWLRNEPFLPSSVFCLSNISDLILDDVPLKDGALPEGLKKVQTLSELAVSGLPNVQIGDHLSKMAKLRIISFTGCSLSTFPDVSHLTLSSLCLQDNALTHLSGSVDAAMLIIDYNRFKALPVLKNPERIVLLSATDNPIVDLTPVLACKNLTLLSVRNSNVTVLPSAIDRLQALEMLDLSGTKISRLPTTLLNLPKLEYLNIENTLLSPEQVQAIRRAFQRTHPNLLLEA